MGLVSSFVHDQLQVGELLDVQSPRGEFTLDPKRTTPVVLIAGGIGLTPMLCMLNAIVERGSPREVWLFYGVRNGREVIMRDHLRKLSQARDRFHLRFCFSRPGADEVVGNDYDHGECISLSLLQKELESNNYEFYICGPPAMMSSVTDGLKQWGVPERRIFSEAFGPASVPKKSAPDVPKTAGAATAAGPKVVFSRSGKTVTWETSAGSLLEFAQANGISISAGCCAGNCGTCETAIRSGTVSYLKEPGWKPQTGTCLVCVATPSADLELDA
jgi:ferredoxin-NADP reductase